MNLVDTPKCVISCHMFLKPTEIDTYDVRRWEANWTGNLEVTVQLKTGNDLAKVQTMMMGNNVARLLKLKLSQRPAQREPHGTKMHAF